MSLNAIFGAHRAPNIFHQRPPIDNEGSNSCLATAFKVGAIIVAIFATIASLTLLGPLAGIVTTLISGAALFFIFKSCCGDSHTHPPAHDPHVHRGGYPPPPIHHHGAHHDPHVHRGGYPPPPIHPYGSHHNPHPQYVHSGSHHIPPPIHHHGSHHDPHEQHAPRRSYPSSHSHTQEPGAPPRHASMRTRDSAPLHSHAQEPRAPRPLGPEGHAASRSRDSAPPLMHSYNPGAPPSHATMRYRDSRPPHTHPHNHGAPRPLDPEGHAASRRRT